MVTTISEAFARRFAADFDLTIKQPPFANTEMRMTLVWSHVRDSDPLLIWFRELLREIAGPVYVGNVRRVPQREISATHATKAAPAATEKTNHAKSSRHPR
jgi:hypothetical protein